MNFTQSGSILEIEIDISTMKKRDFQNVENENHLFISRFSIPIKPELKYLYPFQPTIIGDIYVTASIVGLALLNVQEDFQVKMLEMKLMCKDNEIPNYIDRVDIKEGGTTKILLLKEHYQRLINQETEIKAIPKCVEFEWQKGNRSLIDFTRHFWLYHGKMILKIRCMEFSVPKLRKTVAKKIV